MSSVPLSGLSESYLYIRTGNILVSTSTNPSGSLQLDALWVIDWELAKYGPASTDLGQFCAETWNLARFRDRDAGLGLLEAFREAYLATSSRLLPEGVDASKVAVRGAEVAVHAATHVVVWTPWTGWSEDSELIKEVETHAIGHLFQAWDALGDNTNFAWWPTV